MATVEQMHLIDLDDDANAWLIPRDHASIAVFQADADEARRRAARRRRKPSRRAAAHDAERITS